MSITTGDSPFRFFAFQSGARRGGSRGLDVGAKSCPAPEKSFSRIHQGGYVTRNESSRNQVWVGNQQDHPPWLCTVSVQSGSLGETQTCTSPGASYVSEHLCRVETRSMNTTRGNGRIPGKQTDLPAPRRINSKSVGPLGD